MKFLTLIFCVFFSMILISCGSDECMQADFVGTWTLDQSTEDCSDPSTTLNDEVIFTAGDTESTLEQDGFTVNINGCSLSYSGLPATAELNGDRLTISGFGCTGEYTKN